GSGPTDDVRRGPDAIDLDRRAGAAGVHDPVAADVDARVVGVAALVEDDDVAAAAVPLGDAPEAGLLLVGGARDAPPDPAVGELRQPRAVERAGPGGAVAVGVAALGHGDLHRAHALLVA